jgi:hypothetical protein
MSKFVTALAFILALSAQATLASAGPKRPPPVAPPAAQKAKKAKKVEQPTAMNSAHSQCKKYFALTGALITVPC